MSPGGDGDPKLAQRVDQDLLNPFQLGGIGRRRGLPDRAHRANRIPAECNFPRPMFWLVRPAGRVSSSRPRREARPATVSSRGDGSLGSAVVSTTFGLGRLASSSGEIKAAAGSATGAPFFFKLFLDHAAAVWPALSG